MRGCPSKTAGGTPGSAEAPGTPGEDARGECRPARGLALERPFSWEAECAQPPPEIRYLAANIPPADLGPRWGIRAGSASSYDADGRLAALSRGHRLPVAVVEALGGLRVVRAGACKRLQVFWLGPAEGWGVRALEALEPGDFVCEYAGEVVPDEEAERRCLEPTAPVGRDAYLFNLTTAGQCRAFGVAPPPREPRGHDDDPIFVIDAFRCGNIGRFINHGCGPSAQANVTPVFVFTEDVAGDAIDVRLPRVAFFANRRVAAGEELRYDYDMRPDEVGDADGGSRALACHCRSEACRGRIY